MGKAINVILSLSSFVAVAVSDQRCTSLRFGTCQYTYFACSGTYVRNLCNGPSNRRCCVPDFDDTRCSYMGGTCQSTSLACRGGSYVSNKCGGPSNRRCCVPASTGTCGDVTMVSRSQWGARSSRRPLSRMRTPVSLVFIHHTAGAACSSDSSCRSTARAVQNYHMDTRRYIDVGYNFLVGGDGKIYVGRGWDKVGAHTYGYNSRAVAISFMGNFQSRSPTSAALTAARNLIACGVRRGMVTRSYRLYGHRQASGASTECPGNRLYSIIRSWLNYTPGTAPA